MYTTYLYQNKQKDNLIQWIKLYQNKQTKINDLIRWIKMSIIGRIVIFLDVIK
jgi:hypothetical protein